MRFDVIDVIAETVPSAAEELMACKAIQDDNSRYTAVLMAVRVHGDRNWNHVECSDWQVYSANLVNDACRVAGAMHPTVNP